MGSYIHWFQGWYLVIEDADDLMNFTPSTRSIDDYHERSMVQVSPSMRGIEEKGQSPADNRGLTRKPPIIGRLLSSAKTETIVGQACVNYFT